MSYSPSATRHVKDAIKRGAEVTYTGDCILITEGETMTAIPGRLVPARPTARVTFDMNRVKMEEKQLREYASTPRKRLPARAKKRQ